MLRMRNKLSVLSAAVVAAAFGLNSAQAAPGFTLTMQVKQLGGTIPVDAFNNGNGDAATDANQLAADGWVAYQITATAAVGSTSLGLAGYDFGTKTGYGAFGNFNQIKAGNSIPPGSPTFSDPGNTPVGVSGSATPTGLNTFVDSFFNATGGTQNPSFVPGEDNNTLRGAGSPTHSTSPLVDESANGFKAGVGTTIESSYGIPIVPSFILGWFVVPAGTNLHLVGDIADQDTGGNAVFFHVDQTFNSAPVPEPASLGVLALGGLALLARRRKA